MFRFAFFCCSSELSTTNGIHVNRRFVVDVHIRTTMREFLMDEKEKDLTCASFYEGKHERQEPQLIRKESLISNATSTTSNRRRY